MSPADTDGPGTHDEAELSPQADQVFTVIEKDPDAVARVRLDARIVRTRTETAVEFHPREDPTGAMAITGDPGRVWRIGFEPDMWAWTPWRYATDSGLFNGRWDDQLGSDGMGLVVRAAHPSEPDPAAAGEEDRAPADQEALGPVEIAGRLGMPASTVHGFIVEALFGAGTCRP